MGGNDLPGAAGAAELDAAVRRFVYEKLFERRRMPRAEEIAQGLGRGRDEVRQALSRMKEARVLVLQEGDEEILMANPFSAVPTPFVVEAGDRRWWGNCIWDALGIAAMLKEDATVTTGCADCGDEMVVRVEGGQARLDTGEGQSGGECIIHFSVPARRWWENIKFT